MWRQRFRWFKGGHLFLLSPTSVFFEKHKYMTFYQKSLYWICLIANVLSIYADPVLIAMPFLCLVLNICVYGLDDLLFWTHFANTIILQIAGAYYTEWDRVIDAMKVRTPPRPPRQVGSASHMHAGVVQTPKRCPMVTPLQ
jgi:hypothetical protein